MTDATNAHADGCDSMFACRLERDGQVVVAHLLCHDCHAEARETYSYTDAAIEVHGEI